MVQVSKSRDGNVSHTRGLPLEHVLFACVDSNALLYATFASRPLGRGAVRMPFGLSMARCGWTATSLSIVPRRISQQRRSGASRKRRCFVAPSQSLVVDALGMEHQQQPLEPTDGRGRGGCGAAAGAIIRDQVNAAVVLGCMSLECGRHITVRSCAARNGRVRRVCS